MTTTKWRYNIFSYECMVVWCLLLVSLVNNSKANGEEYLGSITVDSVGGRVSRLSNRDELSCRDDTGQSVDWFFMYKLPKQRSSSNELLRQGHAYAYLLPSRTSGWTLSDLRITDPECMLANTIAQKNTPHILTVAYNDQTPDQNTHASHGHAKGFVMVSSRTGAGIWISHSVPGFPSISASSGYDYPDTSSVYGQNFMCLSFNKDNIDKLGKHLQALHPHVYYSGPATYVPTLQTKVPHLIRIVSKQMGTAITKPRTVVSDTLTAGGNLIIKTFAKRSIPELDIFSQGIAPALGTNLRVQSWLRSGGTCLSTISSGNFKAQSIKELSLRTKPNIGNSLDIAFSSGSDHSKWAISEDSSKPWLCIADLNRKDTQMRRAGGAACMQVRPLWNVYNASWSSMLTNVNCTQS